MGGAALNPSRQVDEIAQPRVEDKLVVGLSVLTGVPEPLLDSDLRPRREVIHNDDGTRSDHLPEVLKCGLDPFVEITIDLGE